MQLILVTGLSGSGKSIAIRQLEDSGCYCIDNLPAEFLLPVAESLANSQTKAAAVAIDSRSHATFEKTLEALKELRQKGFDIRILYLTASSEELVRRFSETRRRHPLSTHAEHLDQEVTLQEAIKLERELLAPVAEIAHVMDTTGLLPSQLRRWVQQFIGEPSAKMTLTFESFGFKHGIPVVADLVFDVRCLPNPYYDPTLRPLSGEMLLSVLIWKAATCSGNGQRHRRLHRKVAAAVHGAKPPLPDRLHRLYRRPASLRLCC